MFAPYILYVVPCAVLFAVKTQHLVSLYRSTIYRASSVLHTLHLVLSYILYTYSYSYYYILYLCIFRPFALRATTIYCICVHIHPLYIVYTLHIVPFTHTTTISCVALFCVARPLFACVQRTKQYTNTLQHARIALCVIVHTK